MYSRYFIQIPFMTLVFFFSNIMIHYTGKLIFFFPYGLLFSRHFLYIVGLVKTEM